MITVRKVGQTKQPDQNRGVTVMPSAPCIEAVANSVEHGCKERRGVEKRPAGASTTAPTPMKRRPTPSSTSSSRRI